MAHAEISVLPLGTGGTSLSSYIARIAAHLEGETRVRYELGAMGTSLEGEVADLLAVIGELHAIPFDHGAERVYTVVKLDERRDRPGQTLADKRDAVQARLGDG